MRYRVDQLAARCGVSVDTIRFYQGRGLLPPPEREGRRAWYAERHAKRLFHIRDLKDRGFTLASIQRLLADELDPADRALVEALERPVGGGDDGLFDLEQLAEVTGVSAALLR